MMTKHRRADIQRTLTQVAGDLEQLITAEKLWTTRQALLVEHLAWALQQTAEALPKSDRHLIHRLVNLSREAVKV